MLNVIKFKKIHTYIHTYIHTCIHTQQPTFLLFVLWFYFEYFWIFYSLGHDSRHRQLCFILMFQTNRSIMDAVGHLVLTGTLGDCVTSPVGRAPRPTSPSAECSTPVASFRLECVFSSRRISLHTFFSLILFSLLSLFVSTYNIPRLLKAVCCWKAP